MFDGYRNPRLVPLTDSSQKTKMILLKWGLESTQSQQSLLSTQKDAKGHSSNPLLLGSLNMKWTH